MSDVVLIQIWHDQKIWSEAEVDLNGDLATWMDNAYDTFGDAITALEPGESFTLVANRL